MSKPKRRTGGKAPGHFKLYKAYLFKEKDPVIDELATIMQDTYGEDWSKKFGQIERDGGASYTSLTNWFYGKTRRPQNASIEATGRAMGMQRVWVKLKNGNGKK